jgi:hypothetical protein
MDNISMLNTLEARELHIPGSVIARAMGGSITDWLNYYENIASCQEQDLLQAEVQDGYEFVIVAATEDGAVGVYMEPSTLIGRKSTGGVVSIPTETAIHIGHASGESLNPGASGAALVAPSANTPGGYQLDASSEELYFDFHLHNDWDAASDLTIKVRFEVNIDNSGGGVGDTVDLRLRAFYKGIGGTSCRTQTVEVATTVGQSAQYKSFEATFTIDYDIGGGNNLALDDDLGLILNLETDTSEVDDIVITHVSFEYNTNKVSVER